MGASISRAAAVLVAAAGLLALGTAAGTADSVRVRDAVGREVDVPSAPRRIVSLAPNLTEILFALGLGPEVSGVTIFCDWPPEARRKPKVGGFVNPSLEAVVALEPDLVLATADGNRKADIDRLARLGVAVYVIDTRSIDDVEETVRIVGRLTGKEEPARELASRMSLRRARVRQAVGERTPPSVLVALDTDPLISVGQGTFIDELVSIAGGRNVVRSSVAKYPLLSLEQLLAADPDVIVAVTGQPADEKAEAAARWRKLPGGADLRAVKNGMVFETGEDFFRPGPRIIDSLERLAVLLHAEVFGE